MLSLLLHQTARFPLDPGTGQAVTRPRERIELLVSELSKDRSEIIIPAPALAEFLAVVEDAGPKYLQQIDRSARFSVAPFDERAAVEAAQMLRSFKSAGDKRGGATGDWQKIKVDQQIIAIAITRAVSCLYTSDGSMNILGKSQGLTCVPVWALPLPAEDPQQRLFGQEPETGH